MITIGGSTIFSPHQLGVLIFEKLVCNCHQLNPFPKKHRDHSITLLFWEGIQLLNPWQIVVIIVFFFGISTLLFVIGVG